jgi:hypothetical protein
MLGEITEIVNGSTIPVNFDVIILLPKELHAEE